MNNITKNIIKILCIIAILSTTVTANPGITLNVVPVNNAVQPGETAEYNVIITAMEELTDTEIIGLSITDQISGWYYTNPIYGFSENGFSIGPYPYEKTVTLKIGIPEGTDSGIYTQTVRASATYIDPDDGEEYTDYEVCDFATFVDVLPPEPIPESNTMVLTSIGLLGILLVSRRKR